ncbi:hypothetical protein ACFLYD_03665, partial [Chloroflexota bacterium]
QDRDGRRALEYWVRYLYAAGGGSDSSETQKHIDSLQQIQIERPADGDRVSGAVEVIGTATAKDFKSYKLRYRAAGSSAKWSTIGEGKSEVEHGTLITWKTADLDPGEYQLLLSVEDTKGKDLPYYEITVEIQPSG